MYSKFAVIFDMDGVLIDNYEYHQQAWNIFGEIHGIKFSQDFRTKVFGGTNKDHFKAIFGGRLSKEELNKYEYEKEEIYRRIYTPHIKPVDGLIDFINILSRRSIPAALATSAPQVNVDFVLQKLDLTDTFDAVLDSSHVSKGKPDPEIYLKTAEALQLAPQSCAVIEDSINGIRAAKSAGMKVIGIATTHKAIDLKGVDLVISNYHQLNYQKLIKLIYF